MAFWVFFFFPSPKYLLVRSRNVYFILKYILFYINVIKFASSFMKHFIAELKIVSLNFSRLGHVSHRRYHVTWCSLSAVNVVVSTPVSEKHHLLPFLPSRGDVSGGKEQSRTWCIFFCCCCCFGLVFFNICTVALAAV